MLPSITSDNSKLPEAFVANIIKSLLFISVTQTTLKKEKWPCVSGRRLVAAQGFCFQMLLCATASSPKCIFQGYKYKVPGRERCD